MHVNHLDALLLGCDEDVRDVHHLDVRDRYPMVTSVAVRLQYIVFKLHTVQLQYSDSLVTKMSCYLVSRRIDKMTDK